MNNHEILSQFTTEELKEELKRRAAEKRKATEDILRCRTCAHYGTINYWGKPTSRGETSCCPFAKIKSGKHYRVLSPSERACALYEKRDDVV